ncbi:MAG: helix-turn-helix transcriptional regulator [Akkermansiaceae bacterium]|nr:helix-turn-helix transcriptional regulator [Akkermansiaceae bacterium]MBJ7423393.1 helix-turn-helix transcriptional regulator [Akkermansiaceae bacterium]
MKIIREKQTWKVSESFTKMNQCLERVAYSHGYRVSDVCKAMGCSSRYFYDVFHRDVGLSPKLWMKFERMVVARRKLDGGLDAKVVAKEIGFKSVHTFRREFQLFHLSSPELYQDIRQKSNDFMYFIRGEK